MNLANASQLFWDGRADSLEHEAEGPITNPLEMDFALDEIADRVGADTEYRRAFAKVGINTINIGDLLAFMEALNGAWPDLSRYEAAWNTLTQEAPR